MSDAVGCDASDLVMFHRFLRGAFADGIVMVSEVAPGDARQTRLVADHVADLARILHDHHHGEDVLLWDRLSERAPSCALHVERMRLQHLEVAGLADAMVASLDPWRASAGATERDAVAASATALAGALGAHLGDEEAHIIPAAEAALTQREWDALSEHGRAAVPRDRMLMQLGLMLENIAPHEREALLRSLPGPLRVLWQAFLRKRYATLRARLGAYPARGYAPAG